MAQGPSTVVTETVALINDVFSGDEGWDTVMPANPVAAYQAPSAGASNYCIKKGASQTVPAHLKEEMLKLFSKLCYDNVALKSTVGGIVHAYLFLLLRTEVVNQRKPALEKG